jgi:hypothetical protein
MKQTLLLSIIDAIYQVLKSKKSKRKSRTIKRQTVVPKRRMNERRADLSRVTLSREQQSLFEKLEKTTSHIFVTGKAGTGKSLLLQYFRQNTSKRNAVVAPTGVAALNVEGQTIHSFFKIAPAFVPKSNIPLDSKTAELLRNIDTLVIDEISMVRADLMDGIDFLLRKARSNKSPFGGVQIVMFGDLHQLPPVVSDRELQQYFLENHGGYYFFHADAWRSVPMEIYELRTIFRQKDQKFKEILNAIRNGKAGSELLTVLNARCGHTAPLEGAVTLVTTNKSAFDINHRRLAGLAGKAYEFKAEITGNLEPSAYPTEEVLTLKKGAQVMLLKNDTQKRWVNGTLGVIHSVSEEEIKVDIDGEVHKVDKNVWNKIRYFYNKESGQVEEEVVSAFIQFPLRLAWAITVHKSQGQTYQSAVVDMGWGAFAHGQTYVALSRCASLDGLYLKRQITPRDVMVDPAVVDFMSKAVILEA